jgi:hypothetical protein
MTTAQHKTVNRAATVQKPAASLKGVQRQAVATRSSVQIQASMKVSSPKDPAEKEAEATAKKVMRMAIPESSIAYVKTGSDGLFRQVKQEEKEKKVQTKLRSPYISRFADAGIFTQRQAEDKIQRKAEGEPNVASNVTADIQNSMASGSPLPLSVRRFMEPRFQANFSNVKIHTGDKSAKLNRQLNAQAFTTGNQIFFGKDKFQPETSEGKELIAHELTHTIQQGEAVQRRENVTVSEQSPIQVQRLGLSDALDYFADKANLIPGFRMFTIILGVNPINMSSVDRSAANILRAIVEFIPGGGLITQALDNHGVFEKVGKWVESQMKSLGLVGSAIKQAVTQFLDSLSWSDIFDLGGVWNRAKAIFTDPIDRIISFAKGLLNGIIEFIKDAILRPLAKLAEGTDGYDLLKAVLGKDPVTGDPVPQTADTLIGGFMKLIGQEEVWNNLKKANAVARAWAWFQGAKASLIGLVGQIPTMFINAFKSLELMDIVLLPRAFVKVGAVFGKFIGNFISWAGNAVWNLLEIIFDVVSPGAFGYIKKTGSALKSILKNPLPFIGNLVKAAKLGFQNFANNFDGHLKAGLIDWLTGSLPGVYIPKTFSLSEIVKFVFSVLGLTWQNIRQKLVAVVGETAVKAMETGFDIVMTLVTQGPAAAWDNIKEQLANLKDMVIGGISDFVVDMVKKRAIPKIVAMFIPGAGFISAIVSIYDTVMVFVNKISKIIQVVTGFINSISAIASGAIGAAASRVENTLAGLLSLAINFLAGFAGLGKVSDKVMGVINTKARTPVDKAIDWLIKWIVTMAKKLFAKVFGKDGETGKGVDISDADRAKHKQYAKEILQKLKAGEKANNASKLDSDKKKDIQSIENEYQRRLKKGIRIKISQNGIKKGEFQYQLKIKINIFPNATIEESDINFVADAARKQGNPGNFVVGKKADGDVMILDANKKTNDPEYEPKYEVASMVKSSQARLAATYLFGSDSKLLPKAIGIIEQFIDGLVSRKITATQEMTIGEDEEGTNWRLSVNSDGHIYKHKKLTGKIVGKPEEAKGSNARMRVRISQHKVDSGAVQMNLEERVAKEQDGQDISWTYVKSLATSNPPKGVKDNEQAVKNKKKAEEDRKKASELRVNIHVDLI